MKVLTETEKQLIFDYCFGLTDQKQTSRAQEVIFSNPQAAQLHLSIKNALKPLDSITEDNCPDELAEGAVFRLSSAARASQLHLEQLLRNESTKYIPGGHSLWRRLAELTAIAAMLLIVGAISFPALRSARERNYRIRCADSLAHVAQGIRQYALDNASTFEGVEEGQPWWKIGSNMAENHSNTRPMWRLVRNGYVEPKYFVCSGRRQTVPIMLTPLQIRILKDFPSRQYITYSFRLIAGKSVKLPTTEKDVLMSDLNPVFEPVLESLAKNDSNEFDLEMCRELLGINSRNHNKQGQNVVFGNGSVRFMKIRRIGPLEDDIFTLRDTKHYRGCEVPDSKTDAFLAP
ncbi:MAG: hypothetical protein ABIG61_07830 [Planctomycetota bacterium]